MTDKPKLLTLKNLEKFAYGQLTQSVVLTDELRSAARAWVEMYERTAVQLRKQGDTEQAVIEDYIALQFKKFFNLEEWKAKPLSPKSLPL